MGQLEIKHLKMISSIARTGNMTKAAQHLFLSQSALSQQLKDIEGKLNTNLFFRTHKKMILTPIGKKLLKTADDIIEKLEDQELEIARTVSGETGELKVGTQCIFCYKWLPQVLSVFQEKYPNIELEIGTSVDYIDELESKTFDLIVTVNAEAQDHIQSYPLFQDQMICILPDDHLLTACSYIRWEDFHDICLISHTDKNNNRFYQQILKPKGIEPKRFMTVGQPQAAIEMVASGFGISIFPRWAVQNSLQTYKIAAIPITRTGIPLTWSATFLKTHEVLVYQKEFVNIVSKMNLAGSELF